MKISAYYTSKKKVITFLIGLITLLIGGAATFYTFTNNHNTTLTIVLAVLTVIFTIIFPYLHKSSYYRMSRDDRYFHEG